MEIMLTAILVFIVLMAAVELSASHAAFAIGFVILIDIMAGYVEVEIALSYAVRKSLSVTVNENSK